MLGSKVWMAAAMLGGLGVLTVGCVTDGSSTSTAKPAGAKVSSAPVQPVDPAAVRAGQVVFAENCVACHQESGLGKPGVAPSVTDKELLALASDRFLFETIRDGRTGTAMPAWGEILSAEQINSVVTYLRSFAKLPDRIIATENDHVSMGDPRLGKRWFAQVCSGCHGPSGDGYEGGGSGTAIGKPGFLNKASDGLIRAIVKGGRSNTPMRAFQGPEGVANLTDQEVDDIIAYLRVLQ